MKMAIELPMILCANFLFHTYVEIKEKIATKFCTTVLNVTHRESESVLNQNWAKKLIGFHVVW